jgi:hypothetical protein
VPGILHFLTSIRVILMGVVTQLPVEEKLPKKFRLQTLEAQEPDG